MQNPATAKQVLDLFERLSWVPGSRAQGAARTAYIFFDPRCPYCHQAFDELDQQIPIKWLPMAVLEPAAGGERIVAELLKDENSGPRLPEAFAGRLPGITPSPEIRAKLLETISAFKTMYETLGLQAGVPLMFVPRPDGTIYFQSGIERGDGPKIIATFREGKP
ncbi:hypothetical protein [Microvirga puerhi]|uniref:Thioredoxin-like fold domain-containing protein n=1 Tax=Microvirga puerhi TaxID=2876078 RepID=A0ABS7VVD7_9HYPH|nr:hypothetical protein [Microvirga puerhi]MBZ6078937.1 hypothetical protein [Microvirga puerhi]